MLAAISALLAIFTQFKLTELNDFLVGDGEATCTRMHAREIGYQFPTSEVHKFQEDRLRDAINRKSIIGIKEVIDILANIERTEGKMNRLTKEACSI